MVNNFEEKYKKVYEFKDEAYDLLMQGKAAASLNSSRKAFEGIVKNFCLEVGIDLQNVEPEKDKDKKLFELVNELCSTIGFNSEEEKIFNILRIKGNGGSHFNIYDEDDPTIEDAEYAYKNLEKALEIFRSRFDEEYFKELNKINNVPITTSAYYDPSKREYMGEWCYAFDEDNLEKNSEYTNLLKKAKNGDITAMLDIASGFMKKDLYRSPSKLICMPKYRHRGDDREYFLENTYDTRYYYWVIKACNAAYQKWINNEYFPKKHIATALLESIKFITYTRDFVSLHIKRLVHKKETTFSKTYPNISNHIDIFNEMLGNEKRFPPGYKPDYMDQYKFVSILYGESLYNLGNIYHFTEMLLSLIDTYGTDIIQAHKENTPERIKYLIYCYTCVLAEKGFADRNIPNQFLISDEDNTITIDTLAKYANDEANRIHFNHFQKQIFYIRQSNQQSQSAQQANNSNNPPTSASNATANTKKSYSKKNTIIIITVAAALILIGPIISLIVSAVSSAPKSIPKTPKISVTEITENPFSFEFKKEGQQKAYTFTTEIEGLYRFDFGTDDARCSYEVQLYDSNEFVLFNSVCNEYTRGESCRLKADETYKIVVTQIEGSPDASISIGVPEPEKTVEGNEITGQFKYIDQENKYIFHTNSEGVYYFNKTSSDAECHYNLTIQNDIYEEIALNNSSARLEADTDYFITITQSEGLSEYKVIISEPNAPEAITDSFSGKIEFPYQKNIYLFTPAESGTYNIIYENSNNSCDLILKDETNQQLISSQYNFTYEVELEQGITYTFIVTDNEEDTSYSVKMEKK